jgi:hypothetical protein
MLDLNQEPMHTSTSACGATPSGACLVRVGWPECADLQPAKQPKGSQPAENPHVVLTLDDTKRGEDMMTIEGKAELLQPGGDVLGDVLMAIPIYAEKHSEEIRSNNWDLQALAKEYAQGIRVTPRRFLG